MPNEIINKINENCLEMVKNLDVKNMKTTYYKPTEPGEESVVRIDIKCKDKSKQGFLEVEFLAAILDADPKLITVMSGNNNGSVSFKLKLENNKTDLDPLEIPEEIKKDAIAAIERYKNASPAEQQKIVGEAVKHYKSLYQKTGEEGIIQDANIFEKTVTPRTL